MQKEEIINPILYAYCKMLYFTNGRPTTLGQLSNYQLESIIKFIIKYPQGNLNGYKKTIYLERVQYILDWRDNKNSNYNILTNVRLQQKAEKAADLLLELIVKTKLNTEKQRELQLC